MSLKRKTFKIRIPIPENSNINNSIGDSTKDTMLYEIDQLEILEEVKLNDGKKVNFNVKDGQFVNKGDIIFTEGLLGHRAMISDFSGIVEIRKDTCKILGQKKHIEKKINLEGKIKRIVPGKYIVVECNVIPVKPVVYLSTKNKLTPKIYIHSKKEINEDNFKLTNFDYTYFINDNLYVDDLAKVIAFGAKRVIVNSIYVDNLRNISKEINKLDGFAVISGFGELPARKFAMNNSNMDIFWGKSKVYFSEELELVPSRIFEHPFWGLTGKLKKKSDLISTLDYNGESIEVYLKNVEQNG